MPGIAQGSVWVGVEALSQRSPAPGRLPRLGQALRCGKGTGLCSPVIQPLQEVRAQPRACSTSNGVAKHKALERSSRQVLKVKLSPRAGRQCVSPATSSRDLPDRVRASHSMDAAETDPSSSRPQQQLQLLRPVLPTQWDPHLCTPHKVQQLLQGTQVPPTQNSIGAAPMSLPGSSLSQEMELHVLSSSLGPSHPSLLLE